MGVRYLEWDSKFFGRKIGELIVNTEADVVVDETYDYLFARVDAGNARLIQKMESLGFITEDWSYTFRKSLFDLPDAVSERIRAAVKNDISQIQSYGRKIFRNSRFYRSPYFTEEEADMLHEKWIENLFHGLADAVLVADGEMPAGFIGVKQDRIVLAGVHPDFRGRGIGRALMNAALWWFYERGNAFVFVKTQVDNLAAVALYSGLGFVPVRCEVTLSVGKKKVKQLINS